MTTISAPLRASARPEGVASWPVTCVRQWGSECGIECATYHALGVDVANVGSDTCRVLEHAYSLYRRCRRTGRKADVVERELADSGVELQEQRQRLADTSGGTEDGDLGRLQAPRSVTASFKLLGTR
jgi:hypothetical protein